MMNVEFRTSAASSSSHNRSHNLMSFTCSAIYRFFSIVSDVIGFPMLNAWMIHLILVQIIANGLVSILTRTDYDEHANGDCQAYKKS